MGDIQGENMDKNEQTNQYFPFYVKMDGTHIVIFGAGAVAARRAAALVKTPCRLTVIAPECGDQMRELLDIHGDRITYVKDTYRGGCLMDEDMDAVIAATDDPKVNEAIYRECRHRDIHINVASDHALCSFYFPATLETEDGLLLAIASGQATDETHRKVKALREKLESELGAKA